MRAIGASNAIETFVPFTGQTLVVLRSLLLASAVFALAPVTAGGVPSAKTTSANTTAARLFGASRLIEPAGCPRSQLGVGGPSVLPIKIVQLGKGAVVLANVCVDGVGPFPFVVDSGSALSVIDTQLSKRFHLHQVGAPEKAAGIGCSATVVPKQVSSWSLGSLALRSQAVLSASLPNLDARQPLDGVIGSDVLSRFGAVRIDYRTQTMSLGGPESVSPTNNSALQGRASIPAQFLKGVRVDAALTVVAQKGAVGIYAPIRFDGAEPQLFIVDTGAEISMVSPLLARALHLVTTHQSVTLSAAIGCPVSLTEVHSGRWALGSASLEPQLIASLPASGLKVDGLIGSDVLSRDGAVVIDYRGARLLLESG
jgi:hypothetical protein